MIEAIFRPELPAPRSVYPRDLLAIIEDSSRYRGREPRLNAETLADASRVYFVADGI